MIYAQYSNGAIVGLYLNPQPDAKDSDGNVTCPGVETISIADDHPDVVSFKERINAA